jgi:DNA replication and repair protein RecF
VSASAARLALLAVRDFRNLANVDLSPPPSGLVIVGENGQGKTNLLEAIAYLQLLRSVRGARDQDLVRFGAGAFHLAATVDTDRCHDIGIGFDRATKRKRVRVDGQIPARLSDALGALPSVMFSPADVDLIAGAPAARRRFLDIVLALTTPGYLAALQRYRGALVRRNAAIRESSRASRTSTASIAVWEPALAEQGALLMRERVAWSIGVADAFEELCHEIGESARVRIRYSSSLDPTAGADGLAAALKANRALDVRRGLTHVGPHRDDLVITIAGDDAVPRDLRTFGSAGQQRTAAIALRVLEARTFSERTGRVPVFLLDDPFAELDTRRSANVLSLLVRDGLGQTLLAVPRDSDIPLAFTGLPRARVEGGVVEQIGGV